MKKRAPLKTPAWDASANRNLVHPPSRFVIHFFRSPSGRASEFDFIQLQFFHGDIRDSRKHDTFCGKQAVLFINLLGKGLT